MKKLILILTCIFLYSATNFATSRDSGMRVYTTKLRSWNFTIVEIKSKNGKVHFSPEKKIGAFPTPQWEVELPGSKIHLEIRTQFDELYLDSPATFQSSTPLVGFRIADPIESNYQMRTAKLDLDKDGKLAVPFLPELRNESKVRIGPGAPLTIGLANAAYMHSGLINPTEFIAKAGSPPLKPYLNTLMDIVFFDVAEEFTVPAVLKIKMNGLEFEIIGKFNMFRNKNNEPWLEVFKKNDKDEDKIKGQFEASCLKPAPDKYTKYFCERRAYEHYGHEYSDFINGNGWRNPKPEMLKIFGGLIDPFGKNVLMNVIPQMCSARVKEHRGELNQTKIEKGAGFRTLEALNVSKDQVNQKDLNGNAALAHALYFGCDDYADWLILKGANIRDLDKQGKSLLAYAVAGNSVKYVQMLLKIAPPADLAYPPLKVKYNYYDMMHGYGLLPQEIDPLGIGIYFKSYASLKLLLLSKALTADAVDTALNASFGRQDYDLLETIVQTGVLKPKDKEQVKKLAELELSQFTPDMRVNRKKDFEILTKYAPRKSFQAVEKPGKGTQIKSGDDIIWTRISIRDFNQIRIVAEQAKYAVGETYDDKKFRTEEPGNWRAILRDRGGKELNSTFLKFTQVPAQGSSNTYLSANLLYKYSENAFEIELLHKDKLKSKTYVHQNDQIKKYGKRNEALLSQGINISAIVGENSFQRNRSYLMKFDPREFGVNVDGPIGIEAKTVAGGRTFVGSAYPNRLSEGPAPKKGLPEFISSMVPITEDTVFVEFYGKHPGRKLLGTVVIPIDIVTEELNEVPDAAIKPKRASQVKAKLASTLADARRLVLAKNLDLAIQTLAGTESIIKTEFEPKVVLTTGLDVDQKMLLETVNVALNRLRFAKEAPQKISAIKSKGNLNIEVKSYAAKDFSNWRIEAREVEYSDFYQEDFQAEPIFRLVSFDSSGTVKEEKKLNYLIENIKDCYASCDPGRVQRFYVKLKYFPNLTRIKLFKGDQLVKETEISSLRAD